ncbi:MAG TPA: metal-dependent phosphohydrolase, partial [Thermotogae bacterium]|nr:metal-dependent phosphohydrolase [Thermotogota bacterium]
MVVADTKPVQRLRFLSQLAGAEFVYPGATHTRFVHSLGTMHICGLYSERIFPGD